MYNKQAFRKKSKGYGFVKFANAEEAAAAIKGVDGTRVANKTIKVSIARPGRARRASNVFVSRLPSHWKDADLQKSFEAFGHIVECRVLTFNDGVSRRCGFVRYDSDEEARNAMLKMEDFRPSPADAPLQVNLSVNHSPDARHTMALEKEMAFAYGMSREQFPDFMPPHWMGRSDRARMYNHRQAPRGRFDDEYMYGSGFNGGFMADFAPPTMQDPLRHAPFSGAHEDPHPREFYSEDYGSGYYNSRESEQPSNGNYGY